MNKHTFMMFPILIGLWLVVVVAASSAAASSGEPIQNGRGAVLAARRAQLQNTPTSTATIQSIPSVVISSPTDNQTFMFGQFITVVSKSADPQGVTRVELMVNNKLLARISNLKPQTSQTLTISQVWQPEVVGNQVIQVIAYNAAGVAGESDFVFVQVLPPTPTPTPSSPTATPTPTFPYVAVTSADSLRVRSGPGTVYDPLGYLLPKQEARITGRNDTETGLWWQIKFPLGSEGIGWVSGSPQYSTAYYTDNVPVVAAPPLPTPTATPTPSSGINFQADRTDIKRGECVTLSWNVYGAQAVYYQGKGVSGDNQSRRECPQDTTTYNLRTEWTDGSEETRSIQINVTVDDSGYNTSTLPREVAMDFDTGTQNLDQGNEFRWRFDGDRPLFEKVDDDEEDIKLAALDVGDIDDFNALTEDACRGHLAQQDNREITIRLNLMVCFATDRDNVGKLRFSGGSAEEVIIEWRLW